VWALTRADARAVEDIAGRRAEVLPLGLPADAFVDEVTPRTSGEVLLVGAMDSTFNRDAAVHFVRDIYPALASISSVRFTVIGGALPSDIADFAERPNVEIAGHVLDLKPRLSRAGCLVVPLRFAGGIRIRILFAMAAGLPVVCSPIAIEGMGFEPGRDVLVANTPAEYRVHIQRILDDPGFAVRIAQAARERVWRAYGPDARGPGLRAFVARAIREGAS
jgi:glycosyltransferase involved in cell wall biosynthesis